MHDTVLGTEASRYIALTELGKVSLSKGLRSWVNFSNLLLEYWEVQEVLSLPLAPQG